MKNTDSILQVQMFGVFNVKYGDKPLSLGRNTATKAMRLLQILLYHLKDGIAREELIECLYGREELSDAANNLRVTVHRLKKILADAGLPEHDYVTIKKGIYQWNSPMEVSVDALDMMKLIESASHEEGEQEKIEMLENACRMYTGEFLQNMSGEEWVIIEAIRYKNIYADALHKVCDWKISRGEYEETLKLCGLACEMYPFDEWQSVKIDCYIGMQRYKEAMQEYEETAKMLVEELGVSPTPKMMEQFKLMSNRISNRPQKINEIQGDLEEDTWETGAFFCTVPGFRDAYRVIRRCMERNGQSVFLLVCTLIDVQGRPMAPSDKLECMSEDLFYAIKNSLRRCDSFTKYNAAQYLVLLMGTNEENCQIVINRITKKFTEEHKAWVRHLDCRVTSLYDFADDDEKELRFGNVIL